MKARTVARKIIIQRERERERERGGEEREANESLIALCQAALYRESMPKRGKRD
jgi:hypothetical protein